ncbi:transmembrane repetitive protein [Lysobacter sp.]|uniref:transmembrane repetitive protein n=1 Tax=Lysobacter sp. TaxID=72226 RepID=UPI002D26EF54|nr:transmembrane repetitive protein [Lysobacter sp.]HZX77733.1 transmembrane repetitive protein [Lysobacter sp.]
MFSAADLIHALQRRLQLISPHKRRPPGEFPPGWQAWFDAMRARAGAVRGATADAMVAVFLQRPLTMRPARLAELTRWQAFGTLWRQEWHGNEPRDRHDRRMHWFAVTFTVLWHVFFAAMLLYLMYLRFMQLTAAPQGEQVVMVEYIGRGTPEEPGGGAQEPSDQPAEAQPAAPQAAATPQPAAEAAAAPQPTAPAPVMSAPPAPPAPSVDAPIPEIAQREVPEPQIPPQPTPPVEQPVTVSEPAPSEPTVFVLPPTRRQPPQPTLAAPELSSQTPQVRVTDVTEPVQPIRRDIPPAEIAAPTIEQRPREVTVRDVPAPVQRVPVRELPVPTTPVPQVRSTTPEVRTREIPTPPVPGTAAAAAAPAPATPATSTAAQAPAATTSATPSPAGTAPTGTAPSAASTTGTPAPSAQAPGTSGAGTRPATAGAGPQPTPTSGTWSTPTRGDDWGESTRNRPGGQRGLTPGLYNSDGSVRVPEPSGSASPGQPPGTITEEIRDLDRAGTWLKRKPNDFEPTTFDKYWVPHETLLAEWVRKGVQKVAIPIPGTSKRIECVVSLLALGGGCGLSDPNLNDQPAGARPPPDIPFKPGLQEDNGSVKPAGG